MFVPFNTDAPIYHYPIATGGLILLNCVVFFASLSHDPVTSVQVNAPPIVIVVGELPDDFDNRLSDDLDYYLLDEDDEEDSLPEEAQQALLQGTVHWFVLGDDDRLVDYDTWQENLDEDFDDLVDTIRQASLPPGSLRYGEFNPLQWVTSNFVHGGFVHLIGNMFFLWGFGLVIEGKLGWWKFLLLYLAIGIIECAVEQSLMFWAPGGSFGASSVLFGLMAIACIWAPKNNMSCFLWIGFRPMLFEMPIYGFALAYVLMQFFFMGLAYFVSGDARVLLGSEFLHLLGMVVAVPFGIAAVKFDWVDCEGWDIFNVGKEKHLPRLSSDRLDEIEQHLKQPPPEDRIPEAKPLATLQQMLDDGQHQPALKLWSKHAGPQGKAWELPEPEHQRLAQAALAVQEWQTLMQLLNVWLERGFAGQGPARVQLAELLCKVAERPSKALRVLEPVDPQTLPEKLQQRYLRLKKYAEKMIDEGHLEVAADE